jgi:hypothetical protein
MTILLVVSVPRRLMITIFLVVSAARGGVRTTFWVLSARPGCTVTGVAGACATRLLETHAEKIKAAPRMEARTPDLVAVLDDAFRK